MNVAAFAESVVFGISAAAQQAPADWMLDVTWREPDGSFGRRMLVVESPLALRPGTDDIVPADCEELRCDAFPCSRFADFNDEMRQRYRAHYMEWLVHQRARYLGMERGAYLCSAHHDPVALEDQQARWVRPNRFAGD